MRHDLPFSAKGRWDTNIYSYMYKISKCDYSKHAKVQFITSVSCVVVRVFWGDIFGGNGGKTAGTKDKGPMRSQLADRVDHAPCCFFASVRTFKIHFLCRFKSKRNYLLQEHCSGQNSSSISFISGSGSLQSSGVMSEQIS